MNAVPYPKINTLSLLRGFAVLAVCLRHLAKPLVTNINHVTLLTLFLKYGEYGVHVFFVISGFVIPYSLYKAQYKLKSYFKFLWKRVLRLHPPYLVALLLTLLISFFSYKVRHLPNPENIVTIIKSFFYLHAPADNPVFWTLRVEAEYYIFIGIFFSLLVKHPKSALFTITTCLLWASQTQLANYVGLIQYFVFFAIGITGFVIYTKKHNAIFEWVFLALLIVFSFLFYKNAAACFATGTIATILLFKKPVHTFFELPGEISYSVYLIHFPIGVKLINLLSGRIDPSIKLILFIASALICFILGYLFWKLVEKPSARLSNKIRYGNGKPSFANFDLKS